MVLVPVSFLSMVRSGDFAEETCYTGIPWMVILGTFFILTFLSTASTEEKSLRQVVMAAKFLDDNKLKG